MKTNGKITFKGFTIPVKDSVPVILEGIEIEYEASFSIGEMIQALNIIDVLPDKLAGAYRKFMAYQEEFGVQMNAEAREEVKKATEEVSDIIKDMLRDEVATAKETEEE